MKKRWILFLLLSLFTIRIKAASIGFMWVETVIEVPLNANIEPYLNKPYAYLTDNYSDPDIYYEKNGVNYTFISTINTSVLKTYKIDFKVYSPKYRVGSIQTISFKIIDTDAPTLTKGLIIEVPVKSTSINVLNYIDYMDNYDKKSDIKVIVDSFGINLNQIGFYQVHIKLVDSSLNESDYQLLLHVKDYQSPMITEKENPVINIGDRMDLNQFYIIKDNYDLSPDVIVDDSAVRYDEIGRYPIKIEVYDHSGNYNYHESFVEIKDIERPVLALKNRVVEVSLGDTFDFKSLVIKVSDNHDSLDISSVMITTDFDADKVGFYEVLYEVTDSSLNQTSIKVDVYVRDVIKPVFEMQSISTFNYNQIDLLSDVIVTDNASKYVTWQLLETNIQDKAGTYQALYLAIDEFGNHTYHLREISVLQQISSNSASGTMLFYIIAITGIAGIGLFGFYYYKLTKHKRSS